MTDLTLTSPAFDEGEPIPERHGYDAANTSPPLEIAGTPAEAESIVLVVDDPDAREPAGKIWDHWVLVDVSPDVESIPEDWDAAGAIEGQNDYGETGWGGPNPPDGEHTYRFILYALDEELDLSPGVRKDDVYGAAEGTVLEKDELTGTYAP